MQDNADKTFAEKPKETNLEDGSIIVRGSKEFIESLNNSTSNNKIQVESFDDKNNIVDVETGEVLAEDIIANEIAS
jgi:hypothetical protein